MKNTAMTALSELKDVEILSVGDIPERGIAFTQTDLREIAANTKQLLAESLHNPPGKIGHDDGQAFARESGLPATGWVSDLRVKGDKLVADFKDVPGILMKAFKEKLYRKISSEVYFGFKHPKTHRPMGKVLRAVAFLGQDIPQVKGLADFFGEMKTAYSLAELDKHGEFTSMAEVTVTIQVPDEKPAGGSPGPIVAEGLDGRELAYYRESEGIAGKLAAQGVEEFSHDKTVESLLRFAGRVGDAVLLGLPEVRQQPEPEGLVAWLQARAQERGYMAAKYEVKENTEMDDKKLQELTAKLSEAESKSAASEQEATTLKNQVKVLTEQIAAERKIKVDAEIKAFVESHKTVITPAIEPAFRALCESAGEEQVDVKLSEKPEKMSRLALAFKFAEMLAKAKVVPLGEGKGGTGAAIEVPAIKGASMHVELHEEAMRLIAKDSKLTYAQAVDAAYKADASLAN